MKPVTFGIIGAGRIGKLHADNLLSRVDGARLKAITDPYLDEEWASFRNIPLPEKITGYCSTIRKLTKS